MLNEERENSRWSSDQQAEMPNNQRILTNQNNRCLTTLFKRKNKYGANDRTDEGAL